MPIEFPADAKRSAILTCSDVCLLGDTLYVKRTAVLGEVIKFEAN